MLARARELEDLVRAGWLLFLAVVLLLAVTLLALVVIAPMGSLAPPVRAATVLAVSAPGFLVYLRRYRSMKMIAGKNLHLSPGESRRLDVRGAAQLRASLARVRKQGGGKV